MFAKLVYVFHFLFLFYDLLHLICWRSYQRTNVKSAVSALSSTSSAFGTAAASSKFDTSNGIDEQLKAQVLAEEEAAMNQYKVSKYICFDLIAYKLMMN